MDAVSYRGAKFTPKTKEELARELDLLLNAWVDAQGYNTESPEIVQGIQDVTDTFEEGLGELLAVCQREGKRV